MTANQSRLLGVALLLSAAGVVIHIARSGDALDDAADRGLARETLTRKHQAEQQYARARARFEDGAYILRSKRLSDAEEIEIVVIPEGDSSELDTRCVIYKNSALKTASLACTGVLFRQPAPPS